MNKQRYLDVAAWYDEQNRLNEERFAHVPPKRLRRDVEAESQLCASQYGPCH